MSQKTIKDLDSDLQKLDSTVKELSGKLDNLVESAVNKTVLALSKFR